MNLLRLGRWSPYAAGAGLGVLSWGTFAFMGSALGVSTTPVCAVGGIERAVAPAHADSTAYLVKYIGTTAEPLPVVDWQFALVVMLAGGAFIAARLAGKVRAERVPAIWKARFGPSRALRYAAAFVGGVVLIFGARMAGGCTSGHALSGGMQLSLSGWVFMAAMFVGGVPAALLLYGRGDVAETEVSDG
jgi:uncharacterized protein